MRPASFPPSTPGSSAGSAESPTGASRSARPGRSSAAATCACRSTTGGRSRPARSSATSSSWPAGCGRSPFPWTEAGSRCTSERPVPSCRRRTPATPPHTSSWTGRCARGRAAAHGWTRFPVTSPPRSRDTLDAAGDQVTSGLSATTPVLGPPLYGAWPVRQHTVPDDQPRWLRELNLDPRSRGRGRARGGAGPAEPGGLRPVVLGAGAGGPRREPAPQPDPAVPRGAAPPARPALRAPAGGPAAPAHRTTAQPDPPRVGHHHRLDRRRQPARRGRRPRAAPADQPDAPGAPDRDGPRKPGRTASRLAARRAGRPAGRDRRRAGREPHRVRPARPDGHPRHGVGRRSTRTPTPSTSPESGCPWPCRPPWSPR